MAAVCSFQRIRIGTLSAAPAAAIMHAIGTPVNVAALPQMALPERHRAEHDGYVNRQAAPTNPRRQSHLC